LLSQLQGVSCGMTSRIAGSEEDINDKILKQLMKQRWGIV